MAFKEIVTVIWIIFVFVLSHLLLTSGRKFIRTGEWGAIRPPQSLRNDKSVAQYFVWFGVVSPILVIILIGMIVFLR